VGLIRCEHITSESKGTAFRRPLFSALEIYKGEFMRLPPSVKQKYLSRLEQIIAKGESVPINTKSVPSGGNYLTGQTNYKQVKVVDWPSFVEWRTNAITLIDQIVPKWSSHRQAVEGFSALSNEPDRLEFGVSFLKALRDDLENDYFRDLTSEIEAELTADYMGQAERLLMEGTAGQFDHIPAAVLAGAVLEKTLKSICENLNPPEPIVTDKGAPLKLNVLVTFKSVGMK